MTALPVATPIRVPKASEMVADHLRRQIVTGELHAGDWLPAEAVLLERFQVSRPTLREAYRILENESIVTVQRGAKGGARVLEPDRRVTAHHAGVLLQYRGALVADVYDARSLIESAAVGELARSRTVAQLSALTAAVERGAEVVEDAVAYAEADARFHRLVVELAGNAAVDLLVQLLYDVIEAHNRSYLASHDHAGERPAADQAVRAHRKLVRLLRDRDAIGAQSFWRKHLAGVREYMIDDPSATVVEVLS